MKRSLTIMSELLTIALAGKTEAGSVEVQPARDSQLKATNCRWDGSYNLPSHFTSFTDNSELCNALKNLIKHSRQRRVQYLPKAGKVSKL
jgi:hypothetical protein